MIGYIMIGDFILCIIRHILYSNLLWGGIMSKSMTKSVTYQQYRDAAFRYNGAAQKTKREKQALETAKKAFDEKKEQLERISESIDKNREIRNEIYQSEVLRHKREWTEQKEKTDREVNNEIENIIHNSAVKIRQIQEEYVNQSSPLDRKLRPYYNQVTKYEEELKALYEKQSNIGECTAEIPVANKKVQAFFERAKHKRLLTGSQYELMNSPCDMVIRGRKNFSMFDDVKKAERKLAESEWYKRLEKGDVTESVKKKTADVVSGGVIALFLLCFILFFLTNMTGAGKILQVVIMMLALGGLTANVVSFVFVKMFFDDRTEFWKNNVKLISVVVGMIVGMGLWMALYNSSSGVGVTVIILSLCSAFFLFRKSIVSYVGLDTLGKLELMRDFSRKEIFREITGEKDNPYFLQMYCYCNHNAVINYMAMNYRDNIYREIEDKIDLARNCLNVAGRELAMHKKELETLRLMKNSRNKKIKDIKDERQAAVAKAEAKRLTLMPDFKNKMDSDVLDKIAILDREYEGMLKEREELEAQRSKADDLVLRSQIRSSASEKKLDDFKNTLTSWNSSPTPKETDYSLSELFCFESSRNISIVKHNLEPFLFRYRSEGKGVSPAKEINRAIYSCIKGLKKINPQALMQINIVDTVSKEEDVLGYHGYKELSDDGIITYVKTTDRFELRLINSRKSYKLVRALFNSQCYDIRDWFDDNRYAVTSDTEMSIAAANRLKDDEEEPFVYQIMMFVVPREYDECELEPPQELLRAMKDEVCGSMGMIPFFFADCDSVHEKWREAAELCRWSCTLGRKKNKK